MILRLTNGLSPSPQPVSQLPPPPKLPSPKADAEAIHQALAQPADKGAVLRTLVQYEQPHRPMGALLQAINGHGDMERLGQSLATVPAKDQRQLPSLFRSMARNGTGGALAAFAVGLGDGTSGPPTGNQKAFLRACARSSDGATLAELYRRLGPTTRQLVCVPSGKIATPGTFSPDPKAQAFLLQEAGKGASGSTLAQFYEALGKDRAAQASLLQDAGRYAGGGTLAGFYSGLKGDPSAQNSLLQEAGKGAGGSTLAQFYEALGRDGGAQGSLLQDAGRYAGGGTLAGFYSGLKGDPSAQNSLLREAAKYGNGNALLGFANGLAGQPAAQQALINDAAYVSSPEALSTLERSQAFHQYFVAPTLTERASAGGPAADTASPYASAHLVRPGDTVWGIGISHNDSLSKEEAANPQIAHPHWIYPGQIVFSPGKNPVSGRTQALIQKALQHDSPRNWQAVQRSIAADFRKDGGNNLEPELRVLPRLQALNQWAVGSGKLSQAAQGAYGQVYAEWWAQGVTRAQLRPVLDAAQTLARTQQSLARMPKVADGQQVLGGEWTGLQQATTTWLGGLPLSEVRSGKPQEWIAQIQARFPGSPDVASATQSALDSATRTWNQLGVTRNQIEPVLRQYRNALAAQQPLDANGEKRAAHMPNAAAAEQGSVSAARKALTASIEAHLNPPGGQHLSPQALLTAKLDRAQALIQAGPQTPQFRQAVYAGLSGLVSQAYGTGDPQAAAKTLLSIAQRVPGPEATRVILDSLPTIRQMGPDLSGSAYGDLSAAIEQTGLGPTQNTLSPDKKRAADAVAAALASGFPHAQGALFSGSVFYQNFASDAQTAIGNGQGATLSLALADTLWKQGHSIASGDLRTSIVQGYQDLQAKTRSDLQAYVKAAGNLPLLVQRWGSAMTQQGLDRAVHDWIQRHGGASYNNAVTGALGSVQRDGLALIQAQQAYAAYPAPHGESESLPESFGQQQKVPFESFPTSFGAVPLEGLFQGKSAQAAIQSTGLPQLYQDQKQLDGAIHALETGTPQQQNAIVKQWQGLFAPSSGPQGNGAGYIPASPENPVVTPSTVLQFFRDARTGVNNLISFGAGKKLITFPFSKTPWNWATAAKNSNFGQSDLPFAGLMISGAQAYLGWHYLAGDPISLKSSGTWDEYYNILGAAKYGLQLTGAGNQVPVNVPGGTKLVKRFPGTQISLESDGNIMRVLGGAYYGIGAASSALAAGSDFQQGKDVAGGLNVASAAGDGLLAADAVLGGGTLLGPVGIAVVGAAFVGQLIYEGIQSIQSTDQKEALISQGRRFLEDGLNMKPDVARALASGNGDQGEGPAAALQAFAHYRGVSFRSLLQFLNNQKLASVTDFVQLSDRMTPQKNGSYPDQVRGDAHYGQSVAAIQKKMYDGHFEVNPPYGPYVGPSRLQSLKELDDWFRALFASCNPPPQQTG